LAESLALAVGVPALLFVVLALSVELIEYRPITAQKPDTSKVVPTARVEIPPVRIEPLRLHADVSEPINLD
jgi:hypothetical protein